LFIGNSTLLQAGPFVLVSEGCAFEIEAAELEGKPVQSASRGEVRSDSDAGGFKVFHKLNDCWLVLGRGVDQALELLPDRLLAGPYCHVEFLGGQLLFGPGGPEACG
jgi:hypothetical protein